MKLAKLAGGAMAALLFSSIALSAGSAQAQFPERDIRVAVITSAGGALDTMTRKLVEIISNQTGWTIAVENRTAGSGAAASAFMMSQPADGHVWLGISARIPGGIADGSLPVGIDEFEFIAAMLGEGTALAVRSDSELETLDEFVQYMQDNPNGLRIGGSGRGGPDFQAYKLAEATGYEYTWVPFSGGQEPILALLGGHLDVAFMTPGTAAPQLEAGELRLLAISTPERTADYPDVPTFTELGFNIVDMGLRGLAIRSGAPDTTVDAITEAVSNAIDSPEWQEFAVSVNQSQLPFLGDEFEAYVVDMAAGLEPYFRASGTIQ
ncbi:MAG: tripartite tricarboxylate transporter substrate binding protein [Planctomycetales bacterium]|nr:tripartite tricarboxylate transporter substrate binding protein [Planctomycetales bacterium]MCC0025157.1 tripartite tricarboxylate transporter substrate binding protein [Hyphomicrobiaceae bacterium]